MMQIRRLAGACLFIISTLFVVACGGGAAEPTAVPPTLEPVEAVSGFRTFEIDPAQTTASYIVFEEFLEDALEKLGIEAGSQTIIGSTQQVNGTLQLNADDPSQLGNNQFVVQLNTLETDQSNRDNWIRENGPEFNAFPQATFTATSIDGVPASYIEGEEVAFTMTGDLTIRETTREVTFDVAATLENGTLTGTARTPLTMSNFGIDPPSFINTLTVEDDFEVEIEFTAVEVPN